MLLLLFSVRLKARKTPTQAPILDPDKMLAAVLIRSSEHESSGKPDLTLPLQPQPASSAASVQSLSHPSSRDIMALAPAIGPKGSSSSFLTLETTAEPVLLFTQVPQPALPLSSLELLPDQPGAAHVQSSGPCPHTSSSPGGFLPFPCYSIFLMV